MQRVLLVGSLLLAATVLCAQEGDVQPPAMSKVAKDAPAFKYIDAKVPIYPGNQKGKGPARMQLPLEAADSIKHLVAPVQFDIQLFASEPNIRRPICMNWDERGRLWIAESLDYPNEIQPEGKGRDRIVICEDSDNDGRADKFTVFADKLSIPTGFTFYRGGVIVLQAPHTLYLKDTTGDDVADERRVLFTGWSTGDTHAGPSNLHWGFDNWIWGIVGYSGFKGEIGGETHNFRTGFFRFKPDASKFEFLRNTNNNSWGVGFSEEGLVFGSTANGNPSVYLPIPNRYYEGVRGWSSTVLGGIAGSPSMYPITDKVRQVDHHGHFTAAAGHALYTARRYPKEYWNRTAFVTEPTGHLVSTFQLERKGSDFTSRNAWNLLAGADEWVAPTMAEVGPDGCVWVIDWYNYIIQHNPTPAGFKTGKGNAYETELRDKKHGRVYRLVPKGSKSPALPNMKEPADLVAALKNDNLFWRKHAQRLLVERGKNDVVPALVKLVEDGSVDTLGLNVGAIHALWTLHGLEASDQPAVIAALKHPSAGVRRNAVLVLPRTQESLKHILASKLLDDADAHVRLATLLALAEMPASTEVAPALLAALGRSENHADRWIADAATSAAARHDVGFLRAVAAEKGTVPPGLLSIVAEHYGRGAPGASVDGVLRAMLAAEPKVVETVIAGLARGWPKNKPVEVSADEAQTLQKLLLRLSPAGKGQLIKLATTWGNKDFAKYSADIARTLTATLDNEKEPDELRLAAIKQLVELRPDDADLVTRTLDAINPRTTPTLAAGFIDALAGSKADSLGATLITRLPALAPSARSSAIRVLLSRPDATTQLLDAAEKGAFQLGELNLDQKQALASHPNGKLAARARTLLERGGGLPSADRQKVVEQLLPVIQRKGDVALGKLAFKKHCANCHTHTGEGSRIGPDLTGMAVHPKHELLIHIIDPSRSVEGNFRIYTVTTQDGRILSGLLASETKTSVELIDSQAKKHLLQRDNLDQIVASNKSLMPDGFEKQLLGDELVNLLEFLTQRGQFLPLALAKVATVVSTQGMFNSKESPVERMIFADWAPKTFKGVPFHLVDPQGDRVPNVVLLQGPMGQIPPKMPRSVKLAVNSPAKAVHLLSGVSGWGHPGGRKGSVSMIVRLRYADGKTEDHPLRNGEHFADYIRRVDVPGSEFAFALRGQQLRYLAVHPLRGEPIAEVELVKGDDQSAPIVMAITVETR